MTPRFGKKLPDYRGYCLALGGQDGSFRYWRAVLVAYNGPSIEGRSRLNAPLEEVGADFRFKVDQHLGSAELRRSA